MNRPAGNGPGDGRLRMRKILRRASLYRYGFLAAALGTALGGSALIAWFLARAGLPFLGGWLAVLAIVLLPPLISLAWRAIRDRLHRRRIDSDPADHPRPSAQTGEESRRREA